MAELRELGVEAYQEGEEEREVWKPGTEAYRLAKSGVHFSNMGGPEDIITVRVSKVRGKLGKFQFTRCWYYWSVAGPVPIEIARQLYQDEEGRRSVRVEGDCGCPNPDDRVSWMVEGKTIMQPKSDEDWNSVRKHPNWFEDYHITGDPPESVPGAGGFITQYHVDTRAGLKLLVDAIRGIA